jgi:hypothetical protein
MTILQLLLQNASCQEDLQSVFANAEKDLGFLKKQLKKGHEKCAVAQIMQALCYWKLLALRRIWKGLKKNDKLQNNKYTHCADCCYKANLLNQVILFFFMDNELFTG